MKRYGMEYEPGLGRSVVEREDGRWCLFEDVAAVFDEGKAAGEAMGRSEIQRLEALVQMLSTELAEMRRKT